MATAFTFGETPLDRRLRFEQWTRDLHHVLSDAQLLVTDLELEATHIPQLVSTLEEVAQEVAAELDKGSKPESWQDIRV